MSAFLPSFLMWGDASDYRARQDTKAYQHWCNVALQVLQQAGARPGKYSLTNLRLAIDHIVALRRTTQAVSDADWQDLTRFCTHYAVFMPLTAPRDAVEALQVLSTMAHAPGGTLAVQRLTAMRDTWIFAGTGPEVVAYINAMLHQRRAA